MSLGLDGGVFMRELLRREGLGHDHVGRHPESGPRRAMG